MRLQRRALSAPGSMEFTRFCGWFLDCVAPVKLKYTDIHGNYVYFRLAVWRYFVQRVVGRLALPESFTRVLRDPE